MAEPGAWMVPFEDLMQSVRLALESEQVAPDVIDKVITTVSDYAANRYGDD